jgi:uncharacterized membrane protein (UPF0127 family)
MAQQTLRRTDGTVVCEQLLVADSPLRRLRGLLGRDGLERGEGLLLRPASAVHTWFMRFPIDAVFLNRDLVVLGIADGLEPWRAAGRRGAKAVLELPAGAAAAHGLEVGDELTLAA